MHGASILDSTMSDKCHFFGFDISNVTTRHLQRCNSIVNTPIMQDTSASSNEMQFHLQQLAVTYVVFARPDALAPVKRRASE